MSQNTQTPPPLSKAWTSEISYSSETNLITKTFLPEYLENGFPTERSVYERFRVNNPPATIPRYFGVDESKSGSIVLESASSGDVWRYVVDNYYHNGQQLPRDTIVKWIKQAASALAFAHKLNILHSDIHEVNFLLDANLDLKVADWAGASIDGVKIPGTSSYRLTHKLPDAPRGVKKEIFALGSVIYFMLTGHNVFPELSLSNDTDKDEIQRRFACQEWPDNLGTLGELGGIVRKCWECRFTSMQEIVDEVEKITPYL